MRFPKRNLTEGTVVPRDPKAPVEFIDDLPTAPPLTKDGDRRPLMKQALLRAATQGISVTDLDGVSPSTIRALKNRKLIHQRQSKKGALKWRATDDGLGLVARYRPEYLHVRVHRNYTHDLRYAAPGEPEVMAA